MQVHEGDGIGLEVKQVMKVIWNAKVPSKLKLFGWRLIQDRLPTRMQLSKRDIIHSPHDKVCVFFL